MEKKFSKIEIAVIKRTAQNVNQFVTKKERINSKIAELEDEKAELQVLIDSFQGPIKEMTGGYTTEDLVVREAVGTGKMDEKSGKEIMQTRYALRYPETVVPPADDAPMASAEETPEEVAEKDAEANPFADENPYGQQ